MLADRIVVINLDRRPDRLRAFTGQADRTPELTGWIRFPAIDGKGKGLGGTSACRQSHVEVLTAAVRDGVETLAVFEDDALFRPDFSDRLARFMAEVPAD